MKNSKVIAKARKLGLTVESHGNNKFYIVHNGKVASGTVIRMEKGKPISSTSSRKGKSPTLTLTTTLGTLSITLLSFSTFLFPQVLSSRLVL